MALFRVNRFHFVGSLVFAVLCSTCSQVLALTIISPTEGSMVREKVKIVVPRSAVPPEGFVAINIDGKFRAAAAMPEEIKDPKKAASPYYTYVWDTKAPVISSASSAEPVLLADGKHEVEVQVHDAGGRKEDGAKVNVRIANKVARPINAPPIKLAYKYRIGDQTIYRCKVDGEILDNVGQALLSGVSAVKAEFDIIQSIEDVRSNGTALVRYKMGKDALILLYGKQVAVPESAVSFPSIYKEIDKYGRVIQSNIVRKTNARITDVLPRFPGKPVSTGEGWASEFRIKIEGFGDIVPFQMNNTLDSVEWESGRECAKITSKLTSLGKINLIPGNRSNDGQSPAKGDATFFFAYNIGKLIKASAVIDADMSIDQATLASLQQSAASGPADSYATPYDPNPSEELSDSTDYYDDNQGRRGGPRKKGPASTVQVYRPDGMMNPQAEKMSVRVRLNWNLDLKK